MLLPGGRNATDPLVSVSFGAALAMALCIWTTRRIAVEWRIFIFHAINLSLVGTYIGLRYAAGSPLQSGAYVALPVLAALVLSRQVGTLVTIALAVIWTAVAAIGGWVEAGPDELSTTGAILAFAAVVAIMLERERQRAELWSAHWRDEHDALDSLLRSSDDSIFRVNAAGGLEFANAAGKSWCGHVAGVDVGTPRFWSALAPGARNEFEHCFQGALRGHTRRVLFSAAYAEQQRHWEASFAPHVRGHGMMLTIRDVTARFDDEEAFERALRESRRGSVQPIRQDPRAVLAPTIPPAPTAPRNVAAPPPSRTSSR